MDVTAAHWPVEWWRQVWLLSNMCRLIYYVLKYIFMPAAIPLMSRERNAAITLIYMWNIQIIQVTFSHTVYSGCPHILIMDTCRNVSCSNFLQIHILSLTFSGNSLNVWNVSSHIHGLQRMNPTDVDHFQTLTSTPPREWQWWFSVKYLKTFYTNTFMFPSGLTAVTLLCKNRWHSHQPQLDFVFSAKL